MKKLLRLCDAATRRPGWFFVTTAIIVAAGFVAWPGCAVPDPPAASPVSYTPSGQSRFFDSAQRHLENLKARGQLAGIPATAAGKFTGNWIWYDRSDAHDHHLRFVFAFADGRPAKQIEMAYVASDHPGWEITSMKNE